MKKILNNFFVFSSGFARIHNSHNKNIKMERSKVTLRKYGHEHKHPTLSTMTLFPIFGFFFMTFRSFPKRRSLRNEKKFK